MAGPYPANLAAADLQDLALARAVARGEAAALGRALAGSAVDPGRLLDLTNRHGLSGALYRVLERLGPELRLDLDLLDRARRRYLRQWGRNESLARELASLCETFERHGVEVLSLKGPLLAHRYYGRLDARAISDLDLLVRCENDVRRAESVLLSRGYARTSRLLLGSRLSRRFTHHFEYRRGDLMVELHWVLQKHPTFRIAYDRVWGDAVRVDFRGRSYRATSDEYELVLQIIGALIDLQVGKLSLKPFVDMYHILRHAADALDWDEFFFWRRRERLFAGSAHFLALLIDLMDCRLEFRRLADFLERDGVAVRQPQAGPWGILHSDPRDWRQKLAALRLYEAPLVYSLGWWALSLPFRLAVYYETSARLLRRPGR